MPHRAWTVGMPRRTPSGLDLDGVYEDSYWSSAAYCASDVNLPEKVGSILELLESRRTFLDEFVLTGGSVELKIAIFLGDQSGGPVFEWELLKRIADLKVDLSFDIYQAGLTGDSPTRQAREG